MPRIAKQLNALQVKRLRPGLHSVGGVPGLKLKVTETGGRSWILRTTAPDGRRVDRGLGSESIVGLAEARDLARSWLIAMRRGEDPRAKATVVTFAQATVQAFAAKRHGWSSDRTAANWKSSLERFALPTLGNLDVGAITTPHILRVLEPIWLTTNRSAQKLRAQIETIFDFATAKGYRSDTSNPASLKVLGHLLPNVPHRTKHYPALPWAQLPELMARLAALTGITSIALRFLILTTARSMEVRGMPRVGEIEGNLWTLPGVRTKSGRPHQVPLAPQALALLAELPESNSPLMFKPGHGSRMSDTTLGRRLRLLGIAPEVATVHGFRSTFRDWAGDHGHPRDLAEAQLQHVNGDSTERAYARTTLLARRRELMEAWASFATSSTDKFEWSEGELTVIPPGG